MADVPVDQAEIDGDLATVVSELYARVKTNNRTGLREGNGFRDQATPDYPEWALRELLNNAIVHRDYASSTPIRFSWLQDRIEIQNPGGLFGNVTGDTLMKRNAYRNPTVAEAMKQLGFVNRFGHGIQRAQKLLAENGNPPAEFEIDDFSFGVTIRRGTV
jgi:ATP-dependent DNA helicase RecG